MNYLLIVIILGLAAGAYCLHEQDEAQIATLQQQVQELSAKNAAAPPPPAPTTYTFPTSEPAPVSAAQAVDAARAAAQTAAAAPDLGTITTVDGQSYTHCKVLKQEQDGITFSHDAGITKIPYWNMPPAEQKKFGYDIDKAAQAAEAQGRYHEQQNAALQTSMGNSATDVAASETAAPVATSAPPPNSLNSGDNDPLAEGNNAEGLAVGGGKAAKIKALQDDIAFMQMEESKLASHGPTGSETLKSTDSTLSHGCYDQKIQEEQRQLAQLQAGN